MKPKFVYVVLTVRGESIKIVGCFYDKGAAQRYAGGDSSIVVQKLSVM